MVIIIGSISHASCTFIGHMERTCLVRAALHARLNRPTSDTNGKWPAWPLLLLLLFFFFTLCWCTFLWKRVSFWLFMNIFNLSGTYTKQQSRGSFHCWNTKVNIQVCGSAEAPLDCMCHWTLSNITLHNNCKIKRVVKMICQLREIG